MKRPGDKAGVQRSIGDFFASSGPKRGKTDGGTAKENQPAPNPGSPKAAGSPVRGPVRRRPPMPVVRSPPREQQRPQQQQEPKQQQQQQPSAAASAPSAAPWDAVDASAPPGIQQQQQPPEASAGASSGAAAVPQGSAATGSSGAASAGPRAPGKASGLDALMSAARGQAKAARAGQPQALAPAEMAAVAQRNQAAVGAALQAAAREGRQPRLSELLVEPSWVEVRAVPRRSAPVDGACAQVLGSELSKPYAAQLQSFLEGEWAAHSVYPPKESIFRAFNSVPFDQVRVVVLGQDPYFNPGEAMGLSFSVPPGVKVPSSLRNIYKELSDDLGCRPPGHGDLSKWCQQGVLLLNASLTVRAGQANSHAKAGWAPLTAAAVAALSQRRSGVVFLLWGKFAQDRGQGVDTSKHHVLKSAHPSGLSASRGFFGCKHFSKTNDLLRRAGLPPVDWQIAPA